MDREVGMTKSNNKEIVLEVLKRTFIDRDPTIIEQYFGANYKQHNPIIPDGPSAIADMIPRLTGLTYEPGMAVADGDLVMVHGRYTGWGPKPMVAVDISFQCNAMRQSCCEARFCIGQTEGEAQNAGMWSTCSLQKRSPVLFTPTRLRLPVRCNERICLRALSTILVET
jgi:predicted SnoaL-like aldol condensation-catalyzing enzyme